MQSRLERYIQLCGNMLLPGFLFVLGLFTYLWSSNLTYDDGVIFHKSFLILNSLLLLIFINFNQGRAAFFSGITFIVYLLINYLKKQYGAAMVDTALYNNILLVLPINLLFFYLNPPRRFLEKKSFIYLIILVAEYIAVEFLSRRDWSAAWKIYDVNIAVFAAFVVLIVIAFSRAVRSGNLYDYSMLFAFIAVALGCYVSSDPVGLSLFFLTATAISFALLVYTLFYKYFYDENTGLYNHRTYLRRSTNLPPKYSLGIISIDGFDGLRKGLTPRQRYELVMLVIGIIQNGLSDETTLYNYIDGKFIVVDEKLNMKEIRSELEKIRRNIAGSEFMLYKHPAPIKITISGGVAEKKRVDSNAEVVFTRAEKAMNETLKFSCNIISPVPRAERR